MTDETQDQTDQRDAADQDQHDTDTQDATLGDSGKAAIRAEREARKAAERSAKEAQDKLDAIEAKQREAADKKAKEQGEWEKLAGQREAELTDATTKLDAATATIETLTAYFDAQYQAALKDLPDVIKAFAPAEDAGIAEKTTWLTKATEQAKALEKQSPTRGNGPNPEPGDGKRDLKAALSQARSNPKYSI